jgi:hypothetical protein
MIAGGKVKGGGPDDPIEPDLYQIAAGDSNGVDYVKIRIGKQ